MVFSSKSCKDSRLIAFGTQQCSHTADVIHRGRCKEERLHKHRNAAQDARHAIDAFAAIAVRMCKGDAAADERIHTGSVSLVAAILQRFVQCTDILTAKALHNKDNHVLLFHVSRQP